MVSNIPKPSEFTALTNDEWNELCDLFKDQSSSCRYWNGSAANTDKKKNPFVWVRQHSEVGGKMKKVEWSYGAYHARNWPNTQIAKYWIEWASQYGWDDYCD